VEIMQRLVLEGAAAATAALAWGTVMASIGSREPLSP
jgi:hypothetical protein